MSRRKAREAYLIDRGKTLSLDQTVWTEGMNIELFLFILGMGPGAQAPSLFLGQTETSRAWEKFFFQAEPPFSRWVQDRPFTYLIIWICHFAQTIDNRKTSFYYQWHAIHHFRNKKPGNWAEWTFVKTSGTIGSVTRGAGEKLVNSCLVPRPHYCARPIRFGSSGPSEFTSSDTSPNCIDREGLGRRCTWRQGL